MASATITATTAQIFAGRSAELSSSAGVASAASSAAGSRNLAASAAEAPGTATVAATATDRWRDWLWGFLAVLCLSQFYFVRELVAAFALFALAFGAIAAVVVGFYMLQKSWELMAARLAAWRQPVLTVSPATHNTRKPA